ncbi:hypothetical protein [Caballeronia zhejiangensis]|uniref:hypothetical protein n=1 Tax=Caballeronia zhejiangensis TaxID=871203 RepID=UPI00158C8503|nr:hypothetical protein [Caballeronia zhejiangensis]
MTTKAIELLKRARYVQPSDLPADVQEHVNMATAYGNHSAARDACSSEQGRLINEAIALLSASIADTAGAKPVVTANQLYDEIEKVLLNYRHSRFTTEDGDSQYPLKDLLTPDGESIQGGMDEIRLICDDIYNEVLTKHFAATPAPSVAKSYGSGMIDAIEDFAPVPAPSVADAAGASEPTRWQKAQAAFGGGGSAAHLPENIDWTRVMALAEKHGDGWSNEKGWSFHCDDDLFNFAGELAKESGND